jgi:NTE family protein
MKTIGLAMTGGGARGAYQAGVLKRVSELPGFENGEIPFKVITAASAGAVNAASLAAGADQFRASSQKLADLWSNIKNEDVFRTDMASLLPQAGKWLRDLSLGGLYGGGSATSLLDASPLQYYLEKNIPFSRIGSNIKIGALQAISIAATNYNSGKTYLFTQRKPGDKLWVKSRRIALDTVLASEHICASAAIPVVFQPVAVTTQYGRDYFGDGCLRLPSPLSPAIRLGAQKIFAIGVRYKKNVEETIERRKSGTETLSPRPTMAQVLGVTLNAIFLDHLDSDVEHLVRLNDIISRGNLENKIFSDLKEPMKIVDPFAISPSEDIAEIAESYSRKMPKVVRYLMAGLGTKKASSSDLISYLLFDSNYTKALVDLGYRDATRRIDEIESFLFSKTSS